MSRKTIICDIDGTLADVEHRRHFVVNRPKDWKSFYEASINDKPHEWCLELLKAMYAFHDIVFVTGRPQDYEAQTRKWLEDNLRIIWDDTIPLYHRKSGDKRQDYIVKAEIYEEHLKDLDILFVIDDRKQVVDMWRSKGLTVLHCDEGDF